MDRPRLPHIIVQQSAIHARGVFAQETIAFEALIEVCPMLIVPPKDISHIDKTHIYDYYFNWLKGEVKTAAIPLGFGGLYNHSYTPNACYFSDYETDQLFFYALRQIESGEEITVNYNGAPNDPSPLWFMKDGSSNEE